MAKTITHMEQPFTVFLGALELRVEDGRERSRDHFFIVNNYILTAWVNTSLLPATHILQSARHYDLKAIVERCDKEGKVRFDDAPIYGLDARVCGTVINLAYCVSPIDNMALPPSQKQEQHKLTWWEFCQIGKPLHFSVKTRKEYISYPHELL